MQDRFKFRIFDKEQKKIVTTPRHFNFGIVNGTVVLLESCPTVAGFYNKRIAKEYDDVILMQCTGLKDKNGKLIYEGDILDLYVSSKKLYRYQVKYEIGSFMLVSQDEIFDFKNVWNDNVYPLSQLYFEYQNEENCIDQCEVVGNIYENPELLENE